MEEEQKTCETCRHFKRHYIHWSGKQYRPLHCGHCVHPRLKDREANTPACRHYSARAKQKPETE
ncbi:MAG: hypothetical protein HFF04_01565 [Oscillospiraceae bacterium]|nr:hypothetical protein [Oscillospiraceae bacterium]